jgi:D-Tyr-tRNAtyr deacylase
VSQFTLHAVTAKGAKPDFHSLYLSKGKNIDFIFLESMKGPEAKVLYGLVLDELGKGLPGGRDKVKGTELMNTGLCRWSLWSNDAG